MLSNFNQKHFYLNHQNLIKLKTNPIITFDDKIKLSKDFIYN